MTDSDCRKLNIRTVAIYTQPDCDSQHVRLAEEAVMLEGEPRTAYLDGYAVSLFERSKRRC